VRREVPRRIQKGVFGRDPGAYDRARLPYPMAIYDRLRTRCGLRRGASVFEIGPGTGIATRRLLQLGANPITVIERDRRLAGYLRERLGPLEGRVRILNAPFERVTLPRASFDLGVAATSFHWLPQRLALRKVARALRAGGWWAAWNNHYRDPYRPNPFDRAIQPLYLEAFGKDDSDITRARALRDRQARIRAMKSVGAFDRMSREDIRWDVSLRTPRVQALWGSFSEIVTLPPRPRARFLAGLGAIVDQQFGGRVEIHMLTPLDTARRTESP
jgi:SAM-dependent methyltransferase